MVSESVRSTALLRRASLPLLALIAATASGGASAVPQFKQNFDQAFSNGGATDGGYAAQPISAGSDVQRGDLIYLAVALAPLNADIASVDDNLGDDYLQAFSLEEGFEPWRFAVYWAIAKSSGPLVVTFNIQHFAFFDVHALTYSGVRPLNPIDPSSRNGDPNSTSMSCELQTLTRGELLIAFLPTMGHVTGVGPGMTLRSQLNGDPVVDEIVDAPGLYTLSATTDQAPWWAQCIGLFADPLSTSTDAGVGGEVDGGSATGGVDGGTAARLSSDLGCSTTAGSLSVGCGVLLLVAMRSRRASRR